MDRGDRVFKGIDLLCQRLNRRRQFRQGGSDSLFEPVKQRAQLRQLPMYAHRLVARTRDAHGFVAACAMPHPLLGLIEFAADALRQLRDDIAEMIDDGIEQFHRCAIERACNDRAAHILNRAQRRAPHRHQ